MKIFSDVNVLRGSVAWTRPFGIRVTRPENGVAPGPAQAPSVPEYDEDGRLYVFRYAKTVPQQYLIERDRIFEYMKKRRLPSASHRRIRRDVRNRADFFSDVRDIQTPSESSQA